MVHQFQSPFAKAPQNSTAKQQNQYFFLAKTTPMHATNSYSLEQSSINNSIYTSSVQLNAHLHSERTNQVRVRVSMCNRVQKHSIFVWLVMCVRVKCVRGAWCTLTMHSTRNACILYFIITIKSGSWIMSETDLVIYYLFVPFMCYWL